MLLTSCWTASFTACRILEQFPATKSNQNNVDNKIEYRLQLGKSHIWKEYTRPKNNVADPMLTLWKQSVPIEHPEATDWIVAQM
jgi:hypothetical protein